MLGSERDVAEGQQKAALVLPSISGSQFDVEARLVESADLLRALDCHVAIARHFKLREPKARTLLGEGQLDSVREEIVSHECGLVVVDSHLTPTQQRNLEKMWSCKVIDRTALILEIFGLRARTAEGKLQVEYARLQYERTRLVRTWTHLERQRGGRGFLAGPGETQLEADKRMIDTALSRLRKQIDDVRKTRLLHRRGRKRNNIPIVALVGYTNAGKSTLFNSLTHANVMSKDMVFATLDPTIRQFELSSGLSVSLVDTVGFISDLPLELVDSFRATLEEVMSADLLLHVRDISSPQRGEQAGDVYEILARLEEDYGDKLPPVLEVWNKTDLLPADELSALRIASDISDFVEVSAIQGLGIDVLLARLEEEISASFGVFNLVLAATESKARSWIYNNGSVISESDANALGSEIRVKLDKVAHGKFQKLFPNHQLIN